MTPLGSLKGLVSEMSDQVVFVPLELAPWDGLGAMVGPVGVVRAHSQAPVEPCAGAKSHHSARWGTLRSCPVDNFGAAAARGPWWRKGTSEAFLR